MDRGYKASIEEAERGSTNQLDLPNPMLAQKISDYNGPIDFNKAYMQPKLDGHRCLITRSGGELVAYTRRGKPVTTIPHVLAELEWLDEGAILDGELYKHGQKLQELSSWIKRDQGGSSNLTFCWYDIVENMPYDARFERICELAVRHKFETIVPVETLPAKSMRDALDYFTKCRERGFEGAMLRLSIAPYQTNYRAPQLLKIKSREDCEVKVLGAWPGRDGTAILHVRTTWGKEFNVLAPGSIDEKRQVMNEIEKFVGRKLTIEYAHLTTDGVPFHAVATRWHEEI
jgi:DNA ligase-1